MSCPGTTDMTGPWFEQPEIHPPARETNKYTRHFDIGDFAG